MSFHVQREMIRARKLSRAQVTLERLLSRVLPVVAGELVGARKLPRAPGPRALVRFLTRVSPLVGLEVGALGVDLVTAGEVALMDLATVVRATDQGLGAEVVGGADEVAPDRVLKQVGFTDQLGLASK